VKFFNLFKGLLVRLKLPSGRRVPVALWLIAFSFCSANLQLLSAQELVPQVPPSSEIPVSTAIEDVSNKSYWLEDLFSAGSPLHSGVSVGETYDDNIFISARKTSDLITSISPSVDFEKGDRTAPHMNYLNIYFAPTLFFYADNPKQDRQNYNADVFYQYQWTRLTLGIEQRYQYLTDASIDIGNFAQRDIYTTVLSGNYMYNDHLLFVGTATQQITRYVNGSNVDTNAWVVDGYALYQIAPKLSLGGGPRIGYTEILGAPSETYQDLLLHLRYNPGGKFTVTFAGGAEYLEYQDNTPSKLYPTFEFAANYTPWDETTLSLSGSRQSLNSYSSVGQIIEDTSIQIGLKQQFLRDTYFTLSAGYTIADYQSASQQSTGPERKDNYYFADFGLEWDPKPWLRVSARYQKSEDDSNFQQNSFQDNQIGVESSVQF
jgi:hypothetical protein